MRVSGLTGQQDKGQNVDLEQLVINDYPVPGNTRPMPANLFPREAEGDKYKVSRSGFRKLSVMYHPDKVTDEQGEGE